MKITRISMGMPIELEIIAPEAEAILESTFSLFTAVDARFSTYKSDSEISQMNRGEISKGEESEEMREVLALAEKTRQETGGYFDIRRLDGQIDPSGIVKGWAILATEKLVRAAGCENYFLNVGGDIASAGVDEAGAQWRVGIRNPFATSEIVKVIVPKGQGVATSGSYERGAHIYNPLRPTDALNELVSLTVIGPDVLEADRFATAAFAMGKQGLAFIEARAGLEAYAILPDKTALMTSGFGACTAQEKELQD